MAYMLSHYWFNVINILFSKLDFNKGCLEQERQSARGLPNSDID